jgi:peptidoglycan/LPS O-acetylase OafA/YrhL
MDMTFRYDLNGIRAIAVIAVVLFHFIPDWLPGGFAGVDVFFVISGFLMTGIIFKGLETNTFNLFRFYIARANRIIPALAVLCFSLLALGLIFLTPIYYSELGKHVASSLVFISNFIYWIEIDYFDSQAHEKWLLHTWSLSVEWQFYIIYPLFIIVLKKIVSLENLKRLIVVATIIGFLFNVYATLKWPEHSYYLLPTRAWEMLIGGVAYLYPWNTTEIGKKRIEIVGVFLILVSYAFISSTDPWPGYLSIFPVLGTFLIIQSNRTDSIITNNFIFQNIGRWSYSIYLWHWPIVVFIYNFSHDFNKLLGIALSIILGYLSFEVIEKKKLFPEKIYLANIWPAFLSITTLALSFSILYTNGLASRVTPDFQMTKKQFRHKFEGHSALYKNNGEPIYINSNKNNFDYILIGDSFARQYNSFFIENNIKIASLAIDGCGSTKNYFKHFRNSEICRERYSYTLNFIRNNPNKIVIIAQSWPHVKRSQMRKDSNIDLVEDENVFISELNDLTMNIRDNSKSIFIIGRNQRSQIIPFQYLAESELPFYRLIRGNEVNYMQRYIENKANTLLSENALLGGYTYIDPSLALCVRSDCYIIKNKNPVYTDNTHLTKFGANIVGRYFMKLIYSYN